ncbi:MAG: hypothetical protein QXW97_02670 [Candidatus Pacearchaeota archaeon]
MVKKGRIEKKFVKPFSVIIKFAVWITTILVSLAVGFSMTEGGALNQSIPFISKIGNGLIVAIAGWIVIVLTIISIILSIFERL